jgi:hypothetical protein
MSESPRTSNKQKSSKFLHCGSLNCATVRNLIAAHQRRVL